MPVAAAALPGTAVRFRGADAPFLSARLIAEVLGLSLTELAAIAGVARNTLTAKNGARRADAALSPLVRIIALASEMAGDDQRAAIWFKHQPIPGFGGKTARDLVGAGKADTVIDYLESVRAGAYA